MNLKQRFLKFKNDTSGMEFIQVIIIILGVVAVAAIIYAAYTTIANKVTDAANSVSGL